MRCALSGWRRGRQIAAFRKSVENKRSKITDPQCLPRRTWTVFPTKRFAVFSVI